MRRVFAASPQQGNQRIGQRYRPRFVRLRSEANIFLSADVVSLFVKVHVIPCRKRNFLVAASGAKKKLITDFFLLIHLSEEPLEFLVRIWHGDFFLDYGHLVPWDSGCDSVLFKQEENNVQARVDRLASI